MQPFSVNRTTTFIKSISLMKRKELLLCAQKLKTLEAILEKEYTTINLYKYRQVNDRLYNLKAIISDLETLELKILKNSWDNL
ncbi:hypothetical protein DFQ05_1712 [Winogradskyella wandonensis]|uniref:Uncharacterized protein n=1 Tax=Winogradskyella wandonensis TaxID=1442586 RepID=A0A4R1KUN3_9FLAO|nr:hypothetical protein DFQ05_1712 [Winogradskyella wandonensis]